MLRKLIVTIPDAFGNALFQTCEELKLQLDDMGYFDSSAPDYDYEGDPVAMTAIVYDDDTQLKSDIYQQIKTHLQTKTGNVSGFKIHRNWVFIPDACESDSKEVQDFWNEGCEPLRLLEEELEAKGFDAEPNLIVSIQELREKVKAYQEFLIEDANAYLTSFMLDMGKVLGGLDVPMDTDLPNIVPLSGLEVLKAIAQKLNETE